MTTTQAAPNPSPAQLAAARVARDTEARARAVEALDESIALSAGAGSGKTSVLVARIVRLLVSGRVTPRELAAVTFTEKAAGELLGRVRDALEGALVGANDEDTRRLSLVLEGFPELTLSTIHGFCRDLLLHESLDAGFAPDTQIGAEAVEEEILSSALSSWRRELRTRRPALWRVLDAAVTFTSLSEAAVALNAYRGYADVACAVPFSEATALAELASVLTGIEKAEVRCKAPDDCKLIKGNRALVARVERALAMAPLDGVVDVLAADDEPRRVGGAKKEWGEGGKEAYLAALDEIVAWRECWRTVVHGELVRDLKAEMLPRYDEEKRAQSIATFDDLLKDAARLLRENPAARARLSQRYRVVLIDEVQDTDPVQAEIAALLTSVISTVPAADGAGSEDACWEDAAVESGRLFAVGDPKQSIYRFRGADVSTWQRLETLIVKNGARASLVKNFRSVPGIVTWVNHVFAELPGYEPQEAHRAPAALDPVVCLEPGEELDEVEAVIRHLWNLKNKGAQVFDKKTKSLRPMNDSDVMILLPAWSAADATADRLRGAGLECVVEGGDTFFSRDEVRLGVCLLRAIVEPADTEAVAFVLRGLFGQSHVALATHTKNGGSLRFTLPKQPAGTVTDALSILLAAHRRRGVQGLAGLLDDVLSETRARAVWKLLPDGLSRLANIDKLAAMVRQIEGETASPYAVVEELNRRARSIKEKEKDIDRIDDDGCAIRITSLFKAKGLEAPVIVLLHARRKSSNVTVVVDHVQRTVAVKMSKLLPPEWSRLVKQEAEHEMAERRRWMYVAATRARDQLVVCRGEKAKLLDLQIAPRGLPACDHELEHEDEFSPCDAAGVRVLHANELPEVAPSIETFPGLDALIDPQLTAPPTVGDPIGEARARLVRQQLRTAKVGCLKWRAASSQESGVRFVPGTPMDTEAIPGASGARAGRVVHAVMERLDLSKPIEELLALSKELVTVLAREAGLGESGQSGCQIVVERILKNPLIEQARQAPERWHEVPFTYHARKGSVIAGTIDFCFPIDAAKKKWVVFDWKSKVPPRESKLHEHYREQLQKYAKALLANLGDIEVVATEIVGPHKELGVQASVDEALLDVPYALREGLAELLELGAPEPKLDFDVGEAVSLSADLAWEEEKVALIVDVAEPDLAALEGLAAEGWKIARTLVEVRALLGLPAAPAIEDA
ncbi:MAG: UvrD-helicase domain-containing protein [Deltaproteobacteria bacterium]|nr:UvrD-helicase domain-containing protein [Deltaproteobacteria bacterium]